MLYLIGIVITFFLAIILISKKNKSQADKILAVWLCFVGIHLQLFYLHFSGQYVHFPHLLGLEIPMPLLHGPFVYVYIRALINPAKQSFKVLLHFLPSVIVYGLCLSFFKLSSEQKIFVYQHSGQGFEWLSAPVFVAIVMSGITYVALAWYLLHTHKAKLKGRFSAIEELNLKWIMYLIYGIGAIWLVVMLGNDMLTFGTVTAYVLLIGYMGIKQGNIFSNYQLSYAAIEATDVFDLEINARHYIPEMLNENPEKAKYRKSALKEEEAMRIHAELRGLMETEKLYQNPELNLSDLAERLGVHQNALSQVINSCEQKPFYDYINELRIEAFKEMVRLPDSRKYTILSVAFDCGFNSKTAFNRTFKKSVGVTPKEYTAQLKGNTIKK
jgi:AraC-like DNA-binding protein